VLVDGLFEPIGLCIEFLEHPVVNGQASGNAERIGGLELLEQFFRRREFPARFSSPASRELHDPR
jgi:hypothetical protein